MRVCPVETQLWGKQQGLRHMSWREQVKQDLRKPESGKKVEDKDNLKSGSEPVEPPLQAI